MSLLLATLLLLQDQIPDVPFTYEGKEPREAILFDPSEAPRFDAAYQALVRQLPENADEREILATACEYVHDRLFEIDQCTPEAIEARQGEQYPLDYFLEKKIGICRHFALTTTLLVDRLIKDEILIGTTLFIREETPQGRHAWTLFLSEKCAWHLDPYWGFLLNGKEENDFLGLCQKYGKKTMENQKKHWLHIK